MARSRSSAEATPCSSMRIASRPRARPRRLDANPGESRTTIGSLPRARANATARSTASAAAFGCVTTSTNFIACTGLKKCIPTTRPRPDAGTAEAIEATERDDVLVASSAPGGAARATSARSRCFTPRSSTTASITTTASRAARGRSGSARVRPEPDLPRAARDAVVVIEAVDEDLGVKQRLLAELARAAPPGALLATNTSSLSVASIASAVPALGRGRVVGMHFFNPVHAMKLVEVVTHPNAAAEAVERAVAFARALGKEPIVVRDSPGFASSRLGLALGLEAMRMLEQGVASAEDLDRAMELGYNHPMGPLKLTDLVGLDVRLAIADYLFQALEDRRFEPPQILRDKVARGELGQKSGKGFYNWSA